MVGSSRTSIIRAGLEIYGRQPIGGGAPKQLTNFEDSRIFSFDWVKDGSLVASRGVITSDVVLINDAGNRNRRCRRTPLETSVPPRWRFGIA